jgi:ribosomal protein S18 acetylase RimI-like enzyme
VELRRPHSTSDFDEVLALMQACDRAVYGDTDWTEQELREEWEGLDLEQNAWLAIDGEAVAGVVHLSEIREGRIITDGYVDPAHTGRGVGALLLDAVESRARELEPGLVPGQRVYLESAHLVGDASAPALFSGRGYAPVRTFFRMIRPLHGPEPSPVLPEGLGIRSFNPDLHGPVLHAAFEEAFVSEWGHRPQPYAAWRENVLGWQRFDPELVVAVWDGDEVAAFSLNYDKRMGDWGWIGSVGVRPAWRRRGLGLALLQESFRRFAARGEMVAALGVDSENPTGATRLYERAGMRVLWQAEVWQKELREGVES